MIKLFKKVAVFEGISYLALFFNMLIIKRINLDLYKQFLFPIGMAHGVLFIGYIVLASILFFQLKWSIKTYLLLIIASLLPFATFYIEKKILNNENL